MANVWYKADWSPHTNLRAIPEYKRSLAAARQNGDVAGQKEALANLGDAYLQQVGRDCWLAIDCYREYSSLLQQPRDYAELWKALNNTGCAYWNLGRAKQAEDSWRRALNAAQPNRYRRGVAYTSWNLGLWEESEGDCFSKKWDHARAREAHNNAVELFQVCVQYEDDVGDRNYERDCDHLLKVRRKALGS